jgi:tetratricopeptide (TPR) repeat protein
MHPIKVVFITVFAVFGASFQSAAQSAGSLDKARIALVNGHADEAILHLNDVLAVQPNHAEARNLMCRVYYQEERWEDAIRECERAVQLAGGTSSFHMWLARAYGEKADRSSFIVGFRMARQIRVEFETAARLDPNNTAALSDLGEFYTDAPSIVGGGTQKAERIAQQLEALDAEAAHRLRAGIAEEQKDAARAESEFKAAIAASKSPADAWMSIASFYRHESRWDDMMQAILSGVNADKNHGSPLADGASILIRVHRSPQMAERLLRQYLASPNKSEDAPAFRIHVRLGHLLAQQGDAQGAQHEFQDALALAHDYKPAIQSPTNTGR